MVALVGENVSGVNRWTDKVNEANSILLLNRAAPRAQTFPCIYFFPFALRIEAGAMVCRPFLRRAAITFFPDTLLLRVLHPLVRADARRVPDSVPPSPFLRLHSTAGMARRKGAMVGATMGACTVRSERDAMAERAEREDEHDGASAQDARPSLRGVAARAEGRQARTLEHTERSANAGMVERGMRSLWRKKNSRSG